MITSYNVNSVNMVVAVVYHTMTKTVHVQFKCSFSNIILL